MIHNIRHAAAVQVVESLLDEQTETHELHEAERQQRELDARADDERQVESGEIVFVPANVVRAVKRVHDLISDRGFDFDDEADDARFAAYFSDVTRDDSDDDYLE